jgi:phenylacetic acid degradation operon negative regulatory protein
MLGQVIQDGKTTFTARSVLASALLGMDPPQLPVAQLVRLTGLFGISENRARVALSRMVGAGEATTDGGGTYRLAGHLLDRRSRQTASRSGRTATYSGQWQVAVITTSGSTAEVRLSRRRALAFARLAELREGVWMRPDNLASPLPAAVAADVADLSARPADPLGLVERLWDLASWSDGARQLIDQLVRLPPDSPEALAPGFTLSAAVLRHLQGDPLLPEELLPRQWAGEGLRRAYDQWDERYRQTLATWSRQQGDPPQGAGR